MSKDKALELWIKAYLPTDWVGMHGLAGRQSYHAVAREAWHAAVAHTLAYVAGELIKDADVLEREAESPSTCSEGRTYRELAGIITRMKP